MQQAAKKTLLARIANVLGISYGALSSASFEATPFFDEERWIKPRRKNWDYGFSLSGTYEFVDQEVPKPPCYTPTIRVRLLGSPDNAWGVELDWSLHPNRDQWFTYHKQSFVGRLLRHTFPDLNVDETLAYIETQQAPPAEPPTSKKWSDPIESLPIKRIGEYELQAAGYVYDVHCDKPTQGRHIRIIVRKVCPW